MSTEKKIKITQEFVRSLLDGEKVLIKSGKKSFFEGDYDEAIATLNSLIFLQKEHVEANYYLASSLKKIGELEEAKEVYSRIKVLNPQEVEELEQEHKFFFEDEGIDVVEKAKELALNFVKKHFNEELPLFDILFDSIKEIASLDQIQTKNLVGALGITGKTDILKTYKSPVIIKSALDAFKHIEDLEKISDKEITKKFKENLVSNRASKEIISKVEKA